MNLWLALPALPPGQKIRNYVITARKAGAEGVTIAEHLIIPQSVGDYPYTGQKAQMEPGTPFPDPLMMVADLAARADKLRFMTNMLIAPLYHPLILARQVGTLSALTGGRFELGVGAGWMREEFDAINVPFETRGKRMDEIIKLLPQLLAGGFVEHAGEHFQFPPVETPTPPCSTPIFVGGNSDFAIRRAARLADGWSGIGLREEELAEILGRIRKTSEAHREPERAPLIIRTLLKGRVDADRLAAHARLGIDALILQDWQVTGKKPYEENDPVETGEKLAELTAICAELEEEAS